MELQGSLSFTQEPYTSPYPKPDQSSPRHIILPSKIHLYISVTC
jgi:hypothetical protein